MDVRVCVCHKYALVQWIRKTKGSECEWVHIYYLFQGNGIMPKSLFVCVRAKNQGMIRTSNFTYPHRTYALHHVAFIYKSIGKWVANLERFYRRVNYWYYLCDSNCVRIKFSISIGENRILLWCIYCVIFDIYKHRKKMLLLPFSIHWSNSFQSISNLIHFTHLNSFQSLSICSFIWNYSFTTWSKRILNTYFFYTRFHYTFS